MSARIIRATDGANSVRVSSGAVGGPSSENQVPDRSANAVKQAFEQGYKEGERAGRGQAERVTGSTIQRYERSIQHLAGAERVLMQALETETVRLSLQIARRIIQREAATDPSLVAVLVSVALKRMTGHHGIEVRVSNHDFQHVHDVFSSTNSAVAVIEDASLERGDFILDTDQTHLDGRIGSQIDAVSRALFDD